MPGLDPRPFRAPTLRQDSRDLSVLCRNEMILGADFRVRKISIFFYGRDLHDTLRQTSTVYMRYANIKLYMLFMYRLYTMYIYIYGMYTFNIELDSKDIFAYFSRRNNARVNQTSVLKGLPGGGGLERTLVSLSGTPVWKDLSELLSLKRKPQAPNGVACATARDTKPRLRT